jgi:hypothetical protein
VDTSKEAFFGQRLFEFPKHWTFLEESFQASDRGPAWRIPFGHHPPFSAGPRHHNTESMARLLPLFRRAGVKAVFSGHEHNFQHSHVDGIDYFVTGAAGRFRGGTPNRFAAAHTQSWSAACHFVLGRVQSDRLVVRAIGEESPDAVTLVDISRLDAAGLPVLSPMEVLAR